MKAKRTANILLLIAPPLLMMSALRAQSATPPPPKKVVVKTVNARGPLASTGDELYKEYCAVCHGVAGKGDGPAAEALKSRPADLTQLSAKNGGKFPALQVTDYIGGRETVAAHGSRAMPIWGEVFSSISSNQGTVKLRIATLVRYIEEMQGK